MAALTCPCLRPPCYRVQVSQRPRLSRDTRSLPRAPLEGEKEWASRRGREGPACRGHQAQCNPVAMLQGMPDSGGPRRSRIDGKEQSSRTFFRLPASVTGLPVNLGLRFHLPNQASMGKSCVRQALKTTSPSVIRAFSLSQPCMHLLFLLV